MGLQKGPKRLPRPVQTDFDRSAAYGEERSHFLGAELLDVPQQQDGSVGLGELIDQLPNEGLRFALLQQIRRGLPSLAPRFHMTAFVELGKERLASVLPCCHRTILSQCNIGIDRDSMACLLFRYETFALADRARGADPLIGASLRDLRSAWRGLLKRKASSTGAMLILALAIGSNVAIFGVIHSVLLRPLPERDEVLAAALALVCLSAIACVVLARRALRIDPMEALRSS